MDEPVAESSTGNLYEALSMRRHAAIEASIKKVLEPSHLFRHLATQHENVQKWKIKILKDGLLGIADNFFLKNDEFQTNFFIT